MGCLKQAATSTAAAHLSRWQVICAAATPCSIMQAGKALACQPEPVLLAGPVKFQGLKALLLLVLPLLLVAPAAVPPASAQHCRLPVLPSTVHSVLASSLLTPWEC